MEYIDLNDHLAEAFKKHSIAVSRDQEFIYPDIPVKIKLKSRATHAQVNDHVSAQLDVMIITPNGDQILESFGDVSDNLDISLGRLLTYFNISDLHPLLTAFGIDDTINLPHVDIEKWRINGANWIVYIGNTIPKTDSTDSDIRPPAQFYEAIKNGISAQKLSNDLHWFRAYYLQYQHAIHSTEFLMDNVDITATVPQFSNIPLLPNINYYSCRNFIILRKAPKTSPFFKLKMFSTYVAK